MLLFACNKSQEKNEMKGFIKVEGQKFIDPHGRQVIFSGINFISKNPSEKYMPLQGVETFKQFKSWGFNCIRLGIIWDGLEPEPGKYNEEYLLEIDKRIEWAEKNGLYVMLDMHQDLFSVKYSDGAPEWATLDDGAEHITGAIWSDSYMISPAVQNAFDNFWANKPVSDGVGVQDHYANVWKMIAKRYAKNKAVIGFDIMNEPFMGTVANEIMPQLLKAYATVLVEETGVEPPSIESLAATWSEEKSRLEALRFMADRGRYSRIIDSIYEICSAFEKNELQKMYQRVANAIREVNQNHILFLEHSYFSNTGVLTSIEPVKLVNGESDPLVAYAAHGYDLVVDTKDVGLQSSDRVEFIFERIAESSKRMNIPVLIGEWGAFHGHSLDMVRSTREILKIFEDFKFGNTFWAHYNKIDESPFFQDALIRPYPVAVSGDLVSYNYDFEQRTFNCSWKEKSGIKANSVFFIPNLSLITEEDIEITPEPERITFEYIKDAKSGYIVVSPSGENDSCTLNFQIPENETNKISLDN